MPKKKKLVPNSGKSIAEIMKDHEATNSDGRISQAFTKNYDYFEDINCIYSKEYPEGKMLELLHIELYCRFKRFQSNGNKCYESQGRLGKIFRCDPGTIGDKIEELVKMELIKKDQHPDNKYDTLVYTALDITDAHVIPPDQLPTALIVVSDVAPHQSAPESSTAEKKAGVTPDWDAWDGPEFQATPLTLPTQQDKPELPWGGRKAFKPNGDAADEGVQWALTETTGDEEKAYQLLSRVLSEYTGRTEVFIPRAPEVYDDCVPIPF